MAYGQTGTGKTYTVGRLGKNDASEHGIVVRALEDIIDGQDIAVVQLSEDDQGLAAGQFATFY